MSQLINETGSTNQKQSSAATQEEQQRAQTRQTLVQKLLSSVPSLPEFINNLLRTQAYMVAGTEAIAFSIKPGQDGQVQMELMEHIRPDTSTEDVREAAVKEFVNLIKPCIEQQRDGAIKIDGTDDVDGAQFCLVTILRSSGSMMAVSAVIARCRDEQRAKERLIAMQVAGGYTELITAQRRADQATEIAGKHQNALQLVTAVGTSEGFTSGAMNLCNELATRLGATRVSLGWFQGVRIKLKAMSHTEQFDKKQEMSVQVVKTMEECVDQDDIVSYSSDGQGSQNVTRESQNLSRMCSGETIITLPLRHRAEVQGALTLQFPVGKPIDPKDAAALNVAADLLAPQLWDRYSNDRWLITKAGLSTKELAKKAVGPQFWLAKLIVAASIILLAVLTNTPGRWIAPISTATMFQVSAPFELMAEERRVVSAPFESIVYEVKAKPGDKVRAGVIDAAGKPLQEGDILMTLDVRDLRLKLLEAQSSARRARIEAANARNSTEQGAQGKALISEEQAKQYDVEARQYQLQVDQSTIRAPVITAATPEEVESAKNTFYTVFSGDWKDRRGSKVTLGDKLFEVGQVENLKAALSVNERDVQYLKDPMNGQTPQHVEIATTGEPGRKYSAKVERIVPKGVSKEGANIFTVYATLDEQNTHWLPGTEGEAHIDIDRRALGWQWTHRLVEFVRLKLWF